MRRIYGPDVRRSEPPVARYRGLV